VLVLEAVVGLLALYLWRVWDTSLAALVLFSYLSLFLLLAVIDLEQGIIPNVLVYPGLGLGLVLAPWWADLGLERDFLGAAGQGQVLLGSLAGGVVAAGFFAVVILLYPGGMGWGDVKMAGVIGLVGGIPGALVALLAAVASGGVVAGALLALRRRGRKQSMPFGPFLALGAAVALLWGEELWRWYMALFF